MAFGHHHHHHYGRRDHGRFGRFGGRGRRGDSFDQGDLRLVMLALIAEQPRHGYDIIKALEEATGGAYSPTPGVVYPTLTLLQEQGLIEGVEAEGKTLYAATDAGRQALETDKACVEAIFARLAEAAGSNALPRVLRAMENLRTALRLKLTHGGLTDDRISAITKIVDEAASAVERV